MKKNINHRIFESGITVESNHRWYYQDKEIIQEDVLQYFKKNLKEDKNGIYIENIYKDKIEYGYIQCIGCPLKLHSYEIEVHGLLAISDTKEKIPIDQLNFYTNESDILYAIKKSDQQIRYLIRGSFLSLVGQYIEEENGLYQIKLPNQNIRLISLHSDL